MPSRRRRRAVPRPLIARLVRRYGWVAAALVVLAVVQAAALGGNATASFGAVTGIDLSSIPWVMPQF